MFQVTNLSTPLIGPLSFSLGSGEIAVVQGPSGSGKSLLLRALADLDPHAGEIRLGDESQSEIAPPLWRRRVALLPADCPWWGRQVREVFPAGIDPDRLAALGLAADALEWEVERLSSGEGQRLGLLRLLAREPRVLLLDEPSANLDEESTQRMESLLGDYCRREAAAALWVSHDRDQGTRLGGRVLRMAKGSLLP